MKWCLAPGTAPLFGAERGCTLFEQRLLRFEGDSDDRCNTDDDEVLFVLAGAGTLAIDGTPAALAPEAAAYVARGTPWRVQGADGLQLLSVLIRDPTPGGTSAVIGPDRAGSGAATAGRSFRLLATPEVGCASATQFIGLVPPGRAPDHFHTYDEVIYILEGEGLLAIGGEEEPIGPGTCIHLPARLVHCLANTGESELRLLGVFRPAGSPAEAYYPDGTLATVG